jgi:hypothetical protein
MWGLMELFSVVQSPEIDSSEVERQGCDGLV